MPSVSALTAKWTGTQIPCFDSEGITEGSSPPELVETLCRRPREDTELENVLDEWVTEVASQSFHVPLWPLSYTCQRFCVAHSGPSLTVCFGDCLSNVH